MAKALNKNRIRDTRLILLVSLLATVFTRPLMDFNSVLGDALSMTGALLIAACALGRVFCTAFLGGHKNTALITHGPFAVCRNPLYVCSLVGVTGVAMLSHHLVLMALVPLAFAGLFNALVRREEELLRTHFGAEYAAYCARTPRFLPRFSQYQVPQNMSIRPDLLWIAVRDGAPWFLALPVFTVIAHAQRAGLVPLWGVLY